MLLSLLAPPGVEPVVALALVAVSAVTSAIAATFGLGGGILLLALLAQIVPVHALIPVHGVVQLGSNAGRATLLARSARWELIAAFVIGTAGGVAVGALIVTDLPGVVLTGVIGAFVLLTTWVPLPALGGRARPALLAGGALSSVLTMFVGATGPFVMSLLRQAIPERVALVGTHAVAMFVQHGLKVVAFGLIGFPYREWLPLLAAMIASGFAGTWLGTRALRRMPERGFRGVLRILLTLVGLELVGSAVWSALQ